MQARLPGRSGARLLIHGDRGVLEISGGASLHLSDHALTLAGTTADCDFGPLEVPARYRRVPESVAEGSARNTAALYLALADAIGAERPRGRTSRPPSACTASSMRSNSRGGQGGQRPLGLTAVNIAIQARIGHLRSDGFHDQCGEPPSRHRPHRWVPVTECVVARSK